MTLSLPCAFGSPFGDEVPVDRLKWLIDEAEKVGVAEIGVADTAGISNPEHQPGALRHQELHRHQQGDPHMHDTYGMGIANAYVGLRRV